MSNGYSSGFGYAYSPFSLEERNLDGTLLQKVSLAGLATTIPIFGLTDRTASTAYL